MKKSFADSASPLTPAMRPNKHSSCVCHAPGLVSDPGIRSVSQSSVVLGYLNEQMELSSNAKARLV
jgi:hypothetical protein